MTSSFPEGAPSALPRARIGARTAAQPTALGAREEALERFLKDLAQRGTLIPKLLVLRGQGA